MAHITRAIEVDGFVDDVHEQWLRFEERPRCAAWALTAGIRWRAEVLSFEPLGDRTRVKLKVEYEPDGTETPLPRRVETILRAFTVFREQDDAGAVEAHAQ